MTDTATINGGPPLAANQLNLLVNDATVLPGMAVITSTANKIAPGIASSAALSRVLGVATSPGGDGTHVRVSYCGPVVLPTADWDAVTGGNGGLTVSAAYYLSAATAGHLTTTKPTSTNLVVPIGFAFAANTLILSTLFPIVGA